MVGASKILTVSYGTFSCTLEGFDDPFSTMKAIAEYFRDLAADDRYFGAEPPTPDAAMLHQIAEREIHRRVEAKVQDQGVLLRAASAAPLAALEPVAAAPVMAPQPAPEPAAKPAAESIAAKLQRIRAAVDHARQAAPHPQPADDAAPEAAPVAPPAAARLADDLTEDLEEPAPAAFAGLAAGAAGALAAEALTVAPDAVAEPVAALEPPALEPPALDADEAEPEAPMPAAALEDTIGRIVADLAIEPAPAEEVVPTATEAFDEAAEIAAPEVPDAPTTRARVIKVRRIESDAPGGGVTIETSRHLPEPKPADPAPVVSTLSPDAEAELQAELADLDREIGLAVAEASLATPAPAPVAEAPLADDADEDAAAPEDAEAVIGAVLAQAASAPAEAMAPAPQMAEDEGEDDVRPYAEMAETPVADADAAEEIAEAEEVADEVIEEPAEAPETPAIDPLAARIADFTGAVLGTAKTSPAAGVTQAAEPVEPRSFLAGTVDTDHQSLDRLMQQADTELGEPEARRRQATLAHLKAAVAATQAEKDMGKAPDAGGAAELDRYRNDLAQVVRPRRPITPGSMTLRPSAQPDKPAPLVLVSEQRVDGPANPEPLVIRPRRISTTNVVAITAEDEDEIAEGSEEAGNIFANAKSFADFAERIGATDLPDLLEAAAAYAACVEGRPHFSRPQILRSAAAAAGTEVSREQSLRSFGMLLRQGKIQKVKRGQFAIAESSRYLPEARKIAR